MYFFGPNCICIVFICSDSSPYINVLTDDVGAGNLIGAIGYLCGRALKIVCNIPSIATATQAVSQLEGADVVSYCLVPYVTS